MNFRLFILLAIIAPIVVGIILLNLEYSFFSKGKDLSEQAKEVVTDIEELVTVKNEKKLPDLPKDKEFIEPNVKDLMTLYEIARKINVSSSRNKEYIRIIDKATIEEKPGLAFKIADSINVSSTRNAQYQRIIDKALSLRKFSLALAIASNINVSSTRNAEYQKIIIVGLEVREEISNKALQSTDKSGG